MDVWAPKTFDPQIAEALSNNSALIGDFFSEAQSLMTAHINSVPYESLKPNRYSQPYQAMHEQMMTPLFMGVRIRVWHYTRLLDDEAVEMHRQLVPSTLRGLSKRLEMLVERQILSQQESESIFLLSPFQTQESARSGRLWTSTVPFSSNHHGVEALLEGWGGESAYAQYSDEPAVAKLKDVGAPRIFEVETGLLDGLNAYSAAETAIEAWAKQLGTGATVSGSDLAIGESLPTAKVLRHHKSGDALFSEIATTYPVGCANLLDH